MGEEGRFISNALDPLCSSEEASHKGVIVRVRTRVVELEWNTRPWLVTSSEYNRIICVGI